MDGDHNKLGNVHVENVDVGLETSNSLDLNVDQNCCSPNVLHGNASQTQSGNTSTSGGFVNTVLGIDTVFESDEHAYRFYNKYARLMGFRG